MVMCGRSQQQYEIPFYKSYQSGMRGVSMHFLWVSSLLYFPYPSIIHSICTLTTATKYPNSKNLHFPSFPFLQTRPSLQLFFCYFLLLQESRINCSSASDFPLQFLFSSMKKAEGLTIKKLKLQDYEVGRVLGKGGFGKVKVAKNKKTGKYVALKLLNKHEIMKAQQIDHVYNQNFVHSQITHPFIVTFEGLAQDSKHLYLVLELINGGELFTYLRNVESFTTDQARFYAATVASCFEYLHSKNIIFRDLKPENLLIGNDGYLKLTDFGFAKFLTEGRTFTICGTPEYIAPEVILNQGHGKAVDWWTLGVLIYEMHAGIDPFNDDDPMGIYKNILRGKISFPSTFDKDAKSLVKHLLVADLSKRYGNLKDGVNDIKKHRWFNSFSWDDLLKKKMKPAYVPTVKSLGDVSNFQEYPDSGTSSAVEIKANIDPFLTW